MDLQPNTSEQLSLGLHTADTQDHETPPSRARLMQALDSINQRHGRGTLHLASAGTAGKARMWVMKQQRRTPGYTTDWGGMAVAG